MKCPYCNKTLSPIIFGGDLTCKNEKCTKSNGMVGTQPMWEKVAQLVKIRNAGKKYLLKPETIEKRNKYMAHKYATDPEYKEKVLEYGRKWRETNQENCRTKGIKITNDIQIYYRNTPERTNHGRSQKKIDRTKKQ